MHSSSGMSTVIEICILLALAIASEASQFTISPATITPPPAAATLKARNTGYVLPALSACASSDIFIPVTAGATCESMADENGITLDEFLLMNPDIDSTCNNLIVGVSYCIGATSIVVSSTSPTPSPTTTVSPHYAFQENLSGIEPHANNKLLCTALN